MFNLNSSSNLLFIYMWCYIVVGTHIHLKIRVQNKLIKVLILFGITITFRTFRTISEDDKYPHKQHIDSLT